MKVDNVKNSMKILKINFIVTFLIIFNILSDEIGGECVLNLNGITEPLNDPDTTCIKACRNIESKYHSYYCTRNQLMCICK